MPHICMLVTSELDRDPRVQKEAASATAAGYQVTVLCRSYTGEEKPYRVHTVNTGRTGTIVGKVFERIWTNVLLFWYAVRSRADIIHANDFDTLPAGLLAARLSGAKLVYDAHELWSEIGQKKSERTKKFLVWLESKFSQQADLVVAVSKFRADYMAKILGIAPPLVVMNTPIFQDTYGISPRTWLQDFVGRKVVLYQGRYTSGMGLEDIILASAFLSEDIIVVLRGYGPHEDALRQLVQIKNLQNNVVFVPPVPMNELVSYAVGADIGLVVYRPINLNNLYAAPNKLFEYMMAGVPCLGADLPYIREIILGNRVGKIYTPEQPQQIAQTIIEMLADKSSLQDMQANTRITAHQFSWETEFSKLRDGYEKLLSPIR